MSKPYPHRFAHLYNKRFEWERKEGKEVPTMKEWLLQLLEQNGWFMTNAARRIYCGDKSFRQAMDYFDVKKREKGTKLVRYWISRGLDPKAELIALIKKHQYAYRVQIHEDIVPSSTSIVNAGNELGIYVGNATYIKLYGEVRLVTADEVIKQFGINRRSIHAWAMAHGITLAEVLKQQLPEAIENHEVSLLGLPLEEALKKVPLPILKRRNDWKKWV